MEKQETHSDQFKKYILIILVKKKINIQKDLFISTVLIYKEYLIILALKLLINYNVGGKL